MILSLVKSPKEARLSPNSPPESIINSFITACETSGSPSGNSPNSRFLFLLIYSPEARNRASKLSGRRSPVKKFFNFPKDFITSSPPNSPPAAYTPANPEISQIRASVISGWYPDSLAVYSLVASAKD